MRVNPHPLPNLSVSLVLFFLLHHGRTPNSIISWVQFLPGVISSVVANVPKYGDTPKLKTDFLRVLDLLQRPEDTPSPPGPGVKLPGEPMSPLSPASSAMKQWQIPVEHLQFKNLLAEGFYGEVYL